VSTSASDTPASRDRPRRGRPATGDATDRRAALVSAARRQFADRGFTGASLRSIAQEAGVDASLVSHYFGDKQALLVATLDLPVDPAAQVRAVLDGPSEGLGERLVRAFVTTWDPHAQVFATLVRTAVAGDLATSVVGTLLRSVVVEGLADRLDGEQVELRATLVASAVLGLGVARYVARLEPLASTPADDVARLHGPAVQSLVEA
jgi:AcrR family transcriptional regulator